MKVIKSEFIGHVVAIFMCFHILFLICVGLLFTNLFYIYFYYCTLFHILTCIYVYILYSIYIYILLDLSIYFPSMHNRDHPWISLIISNMLRHWGPTLCCAQFRHNPIEQILCRSVATSFILLSFIWNTTQTI